ncbi:MAG: hypothetical protein ACRYFK_19330 [Janthinobacterium lividum]
MKLLLKTASGLLLAGLALSSCSVFRSDVNSRNPLVAEQARRVNELESQLNSQKTIVTTERAKQKDFEYQLKSARQELRARKQQAKTGY